MNIQSFDTIIHLVGEQPLPIYMGMLQFECPNHILAVTEETLRYGKILQKLAAKRKLNVSLLPLDAYNTDSAQKRFSSITKNKPPGSLAFNLTGGTKPMFVAGFLTAFNDSFPMYYIETANRELLWLEASSMRKEELRPTMDSVATFVELAGCRLDDENGRQQAEWAEEHDRLLQECWNRRTVLCKAYTFLREYQDRPAFKYPHGGKDILIELKGITDDYSGIFKLGNMRLEQPNWKDLAAFAMGGWFEMLVYRHLLPLKKKGLIKDIILNAEAKPEEEIKGRESSIQEFDIAFTDGFLLTIIECKSGKVRQEHLQKLENLTRRFGGHFGRGLIVSRLAIGANNELRIKESRNMAAICKQAVKANPHFYLEVKPREIR